MPIAFAPIVLENYDTCRVEEPVRLPEVRKRAHTDPRLEELVSGLDWYLDVATSLALPADEVAKLIEAGRRLLRQAPGFCALVTHIQSLDQRDRADTPASTR